MLPSTVFLAPPYCGTINSPQPLKIIPKAYSRDIRPSRSGGSISLKARQSFKTFLAIAIERLTTKMVSTPLRKMIRKIFENMSEKIFQVNNQSRPSQSVYLIFRPRFLNCPCTPAILCDMEYIVDSSRTTS
jgi:hypothetical protein